MAVDLSVINGLDPSEDQQKHSNFQVPNAKENPTNLSSENPTNLSSSSDSQRCRTANPHLTSNHSQKFPLPQAMAGYPLSASRDPQPSSLSLLNRSDFSLCSTFLCSLVSRADSKSLFYFGTLDFNPTLQVSNGPNTKPCCLAGSSSHVSRAEQRIGVLSLVCRTKGTVRRLSAFKHDDGGFAFLVNRSWNPLLMPPLPKQHPLPKLDLLSKLNLFPLQQMLRHFHLDLVIKPK
ncbi:uncharacterized protein LOC126727162 [Quercus robur]|uniref:uncharacterized protein LOC126727162 n=1 Tax=Quercus robur TaxID=38942 RepID=UPI0021635269|nr:uncharacterized protein LOC126727162 [Quercus robur]